jgi:hypothetical protein
MCAILTINQDFPYRLAPRPPWISLEKFYHTLLAITSKSKSLLSNYYNIFPRISQMEFLITGGALSAF